MLSPQQDVKTPAVSAANFCLKRFHQTNAPSGTSLFTGNISLMK